MDAPDDLPTTLPVPSVPLRTPLPPPPPVLRRRNLTGGWRWVLAVGWIAIVVSLLFLYDAAVRIVGEQIVWNRLMAAPIVVPALVVIAVGLDWKLTLPISALAAGSVAVVGALDLHKGYQTVGAAELALAASGLLLTIAALAGRYRHQPFMPPPLAASPLSAPVAAGPSFLGPIDQLPGWPPAPLASPPAQPPGANTAG
jgi:hypothetical protein